MVLAASAIEVLAGASTEPFESTDIETSEMTLEECTAKLRASVQPIVNPPPTPPAEGSGPGKASSESRTGIEQISGRPFLTPKVSEDSVTKRISQHDPETEEDTHEEEVKTPNMTETNEAIQLLWLVYTENIAKQCKSKCPNIKLYRAPCKCQSKSDKVLSDIPAFLQSTPEEEEQNWSRLLDNTKAMLEHSWVVHEDVCPPSRFDLGYEGLKLLVLLKEEKFPLERKLFGDIFERQFGAEFDGIILSEKSIEFFRIEAEYVQKSRIDLAANSWYIPVQR
jgi:hypothetical protein